MFRLHFPFRANILSMEGFFKPTGSKNGKKEMKRSGIALRICIFAVFTFLCGLLIWDGFVLPRDTWSRRVLRPAEPVAAGFTPLQLQLLPWPNWFLADKNLPIRGVALGYFLQQNDIDGVSMALMHSANARKRGVSMSVVELSGESSGLSLFLAGGSVSNRGCSIGLWNMAEQNSGVQLGLVNQVQKDIIADYDLKPAPETSEFGVQAGMVNYSEGRGVQIGLWNTNPRSLLKHFPIINFCF